METKGVITRPVPHNVKETIDKLQAFVEMNGATIYARIDQQAELQKAGITIHPLEFLMFGNPAAGGKLMQRNPVIALDLPLKIIAYEDEQQQVWLTYNDAGYLQERYALKQDSNSPLNIDKLVDKFLAGSTA